MAGTKHERFVELDALRGLAAVAVVAFHYLHQYPHRFDRTIGAPAILDFGQYGVELFFIISGFVIFMTVERLEGTREFAVARFTRLYPLYWISLAATFLVLSRSPLPDVQVSGAQALVNITMLEGFFNVPYVDGVYWSLTVELGFYLVVGALLASRQSKRTLEALLLLALGFAFANLMSRWVVLDGPLMFVDDHAKFLRHAHLFAAGVAFYLLIVRNRRDSVVFGAIALAPVIEFVDGDRTSAVVVAVLVAVFWVAVAVKPKVLRWRPLLFMGAISYALYLIHQNIGYVLIRELDSRGVAHWISVLSTLVVVTVLAALLTRFVDGPVQRTLRTKLARPASSNEPVPGS